MISTCIYKIIKLSICPVLLDISCLLAYLSIHTLGTHLNANWNLIESSQIEEFKIDYSVK